MATNFEASELQQSTPVRILSLGPTATKVLIITVFTVLLLLYLAQSTQGATRQYQVRNLEDSLAAATQDRNALELESIRLQSLAAVAPAPTPAPTPSTSQQPANPPAATAPELSPTGVITSVTNP